MNHPSLDCLIIGENSLPLLCADFLLRAGHRVVGIITPDETLVGWAKERSIPTIHPRESQVAFASARPHDYLFSIVNGHIVPNELLALPRRASINFHDGPLPLHAGFNSPCWALISRENRYGITWHRMTNELDAGDIIKQRLFDISPDETAFTLNAKCYEAGLESFPEMIAELADGSHVPQAQDLTLRTYHPRFERPYAACLLDWNRSIAEIEALSRALDFGVYANPFGVLKIFHQGEFFLTSELAPAAQHSHAAPGTIVAATADALTVAVLDGDIVIRKITTVDGKPIEILAFRGQRSLDALSPEAGRRISELNTAVSRHEPFWVRRLADLKPAGMGGGTLAGRLAAIPVKIGDSVLRWLNSRPETSPAEAMVAAFGVYLARSRSEGSFDIGWRTNGPQAVFAEVVPLRVALDLEASSDEAVSAIRREIRELGKRQTYARDLVVRYPELRTKSELRTAPSFDITVEIAEVTERLELAPGTVLGLIVAPDGSGFRLAHDLGALPPQAAAELLERLLTLLDGMASEDGRPIAALPLLSEKQRHRMLVEWNATECEYASKSCIHHLFEAHAERTPDAIALIHEDRQWTYQELNTRANQLAAYLGQLGAGPAAPVGISMKRSLDLMVALLGVLKAGAAYLPIDPTYPHDRQAFLIEDSGVSLVLTQEDLLKDLPASRARVIPIDTEWRLIGKSSSAGAGSPVTPDNLAYIIYTSGSTGKPKGVMVTHRNVVNFFTGMDQSIGAERGVWLAVTSISFDISVLELFWTLTRGFVVVLAGGERQAIASEPVSAHKKLDFSLYYFASYDGGSSRDKYRLLLEGAKFADRSGFDAVWTPERHFHSFGGLYPNPSVTSAAVAAATERVQIRAGSVVLPLHSPLRVAEEWSVVDNISGGRVGISFASGWHARDFVLAPQNFADSKNIMFRDIETVRRLWRGESIPFTDGKGNQEPVSILPRPIQAELPVWITAAGNPETFRLAGAKGFNLLTHLLGQSVDELGQKISVYREARKEAGLDPQGGQVTLMLHTFVGESLEEVREQVRKPFTEYLKTSVDLIKNSPWAFPAARRPGQDPSTALKLTDLAPEDLEALLAHAFDRYFESSGFFGTPEQCIKLAGRLQALGVDEIACLIDFGVDPDDVLASLPRLNEVREGYNQPAVAARDFSLAGLIRRHEVTHLQCTPSMAKMLLLAEESRDAMRPLRKLMIGGEALPPGLAHDLQQATDAEILNMYGPTETTIWSTVWRVHGERVSIGRPIANTQVYIVDSHMQPTPVGVPGELLIGGAGVTRGYLNRPELTADRFIPNTFGGDSRLYRTGDIARYLSDGGIEFLGRADHQVKIRGFRIELGEIENVVRACPGVQDAVVVAREDTPGEKQLVAYLTSRPGEDLCLIQAREAIRAKLPDYMAPMLVELPSLPLTHNGKIDRKALPAPDRARAASGRRYEAPRNELEQTIASIWQEALNLERVGLEDNFFDLGGHSILAVQVVTSLRATLKRKISLIEMFRYPTVNSLAAYFRDDQPAVALVDQGAERAQARRGAMAQRTQLRQNRLSPSPAGGRSGAK